MKIKIRDLEEKAKDAFKNYKDGNYDPGTHKCARSKFGDTIDDGNLEDAEEARKQCEPECNYYDASDTAAAREVVTCDKTIHENARKIAEKLEEKRLTDWEKSQPDSSRIAWDKLKELEAETKTEPAVVPVESETHITEDGELGKYEFVNHPAHYNHYTKEVIDMMVDIFGREATALWCEMTAFKYRMRAGTKPGNEITEDMDKEKWYLDKAKELRK